MFTVLNSDGKMIAYRAYVAPKFLPVSKLYILLLYSYFYNQEKFGDIILIH